jgi:hypothetical protein
MLMAINPYYTLLLSVGTFRDIVHEYISPDNKHSALIIIGMQHDFTLPAATAEIL